MDFDILFWVNITTIITGILGAAAFIWKLDEYNKSQKGFIVSKLECSHKCLNENCYIIAQTSLKNVGKKTKKIKIAYLLLLSPSDTSHDEGIRKIYESIEHKDSTKIDRSVRSNKEENHVTPQMFYDLYDKCAEKAGGELPEIKSHDGDAIFRLLLYYTKFHSQLGGSGHQSSRIVRQIPHKGIWSVYFGFIAEDWPEDPHDFYSLHQDVIA